MSDDLVVWLRAQLDEDEARARNLLVYAQQTVLTLQDPHHLGKFIPGWHDWPDVERMCTERLAEVEAKRQIIGLHDDDGGAHECPAIDEVVTKGEHYTAYERECMTLRLLALPYSDRPGYREEWPRDTPDVSPA